jgi:hypothetical protein
MDHCHGTTRKGRPCRFRIPTGAAYCINHEPGANTHMAAKRASAASHPRAPAEELMRAVISFADRASIQSALDTLVRLKLAGRISDSTARIVLRACHIAAHNFDSPRDTLTGPAPQAHESFAYYDRVNALLHTVDPLLDEAEDREAEREAWEE